MMEPRFRFDAALRELVQRVSVDMTMKDGMDTVVNVTESYILIEVEPSVSKTCSG
jgi:hypothetical protein